eukprot:2836183-Alexandrium_andersonii.AAC.1
MFAVSKGVRVRTRSPKDIVSGVRCARLCLAPRRHFGNARGGVRTVCPGGMCPTVRRRDTQCAPR